MSQNAQKDRTKRGPLAALALILLPLLALAQAADQPPAKPGKAATASDPAAQQPKSTERDVIVAIRAPEDITGAELNDRLRSALGRAGLGHGEISVTPISQDDYESFAKVIEGPDSVVPCDDLVTRSQRLRYWTVRLPGGYSTLDHMDVTYMLRNDPGAPAKTEKIEPVSRPEGKRNASARLVYRDPASRQLEFRPDPNWLLLRYELVLHEADGNTQRKQGTFFVEHYCKLMVAGYTGTARQLFEAVGDGSVVGPMPGFHPPRPLVVYIADLMHPDTPEPGRGRWMSWMGECKYQVRLSRPAGSRATGAWILFPLTKARAEAVKKELDAKYAAAELTSATTAEALRSKGMLAGYKTNTGTGDVKLTAGDDPQWCEASSDESASEDAVQQFIRSFQLVNPQDWIKEPHLADAWQVVVYVAKIRIKEPPHEIVSEVARLTRPLGASKSWYWHVQPAGCWSSAEGPFAKDKAHANEPKLGPANGH